MTSQNQSFPVVGIGASAGGIPAIEGFFKGLGQEAGLAFVIVTHLSPERESLLHEVVSRYTSLPVAVTEEGMAIEAGNVYVMPENVVLTVKHGRFVVKRLNMLSRERKLIDVFLGSLAMDRGEYAVGVILSGGDGDGTLGVKAIKEHGGLTLAQAADEFGPRNPDMPESAISTGLIDLAVPADEMGEKLIQYARSFSMLAEMVDGEAASAGGSAEQASKAIYELLHTHSGHDFSGYKAKTFLRRVTRRMQVVQASSLDEYVERLRRDPTEVMNLFRDLLINVTNFFRDKESFETLANQIIPKLFQQRGAGDTIRIWVPGCATGEEAYSLGILMREHMATLPVVPRVQIFATDIDDAALGVARAGRYPEALLEDVSEERRQRFFTSDGTSFAVNKEVRDLCIFSPHSVIRDPPFSRMDMVSCRNLLIYFGPQIQNQVIPTFHYALRPGAYLFLGTSEGISQHGDLFSPVDKKHRIFQSREHPHAPRLPMVLASRSGSIVEMRGGAAMVGSFHIKQTVEAQVLERYAPAHVVVNADGDVLYYSSRTGRFLEAPPGAPSRQLMTMARKGLRLDLRTAFREAVQSGRTVIREGLEVEEDGDLFQAVTLTIEPLADRRAGEALYLVLFTPVGPSRSRTATEDHNRYEREGAVAGLEQELRDTRERLQSTIEEYETALEELKSSNEELVSVNEEAQSSNEELEASKEEMQSLNEELNTINAELGGKVEELDRANSDLRNLFESTQIATIFLDRNLVIRNFTPAAAGFFNLRPTDVGRPLTELAGYQDYPDLKRNIRKVFDSGELIEHRFSRGSSGSHYLVRLVPYRDDGGKIGGVVVSFIDVAGLVEAEDQQKVLVAELNHRVKNMLAVVITLVHQSHKRARSLDDFANALTGRIEAMARAYVTLSRENWHALALTELIGDELAPFDADRIVISGPALDVSPQAGLSIGMVVHELATNAVKHGALGTPEGRVEVSWSVREARLQLEWIEHGGPPAAAPEATGFGFKLIRGEIEHRHGGKVDAEFGKDGLKVRLELALTS